MEIEKRGVVCAALEHPARIRNELCKQMTPSWQIILNSIQTHVRGAAYIMNLSVTQKTTVFVETDTEEGKSCDGDITPTGSTSPSWKNNPDPLALPSRVRRTCLVAKEDTEENKWSGGT